MIIRNFKIIAILAVLVLAGGACSSSPRGPELVGSEDVNADTDPNLSNDDPGGGDNPTPTSLDELIAALTFADAGSEGFQGASASDRAAFQEIITDLLNGTRPSEADVTALSYRMTELDLDGDSVIALEDDQASGGTYLVNLSSLSDLVIEVPHPVSDANTLEEGVAIFKALPAKALFIAGTHRCANTAESSCSGTSAACGTEGPYRSSDVSHATDNLFHAAHQAANDASIAINFIQLHGFTEQADDPQAIVSNGTTRDVGAFAFVNELEAALESRLSAGEFASSCNLSGDPNVLCGTDNVQGRYTNGSADACSIAPSGITGRFLHLQQAGSLISDSAGWQRVSDSINDVF